MFLRNRTGIALIALSLAGCGDCGLPPHRLTLIDFEMSDAPVELAAAHRAVWADEGTITFYGPGTSNEASLDILKGEFLQGANLSLTPEEP